MIAGGEAVEAGVSLQWHWSEWVLCAQGLLAIPFLPRSGQLHPQEIHQRHQSQYAEPPLT